MPEFPAPADERTVSGRVEDADGRPLVGAEVQVEGRPEAARTGAGGQFSLRTVPAAGPTVLVVQDGRRTARVPVDPREGGSLRVVAAPPDVVPVCVLTPGSAPVPARFGWMALTSRGAGLVAGPAGEAPSPRFAAGSLAAGTHALVFWAGPFLPTVADGIVLDGRTSHALLTVELTRRGSSVAGRVLYPAGEPRANASVAVRPEDSSVRLLPGRATCLSDAGGRYRIEGLPPGRYTLVVQAGAGPATE